MNALAIALVGVSGTVLGILVKTLIDRHDEDNRRARQEAREDVVWRRQHALDAAAIYLTAVGNVQWHGRNVDTVNQQIAAATEANDAPEVHRLRVLADQQQVQKTEHMVRANDALSRLSLLLKHSTYGALSQHFQMAVTNPLDLNLPFIGAQVDALLRVDLGLPARDAPAGDAMSFADAVSEIEALRARTATHVETRSGPLDRQAGQN